MFGVSYSIPSISIGGLVRDKTTSFGGLGFFKFGFGIVQRGMKNVSFTY